MTLGQVCPECGCPVAESMHPSSSWQQSASFREHFRGYRETACRMLGLIHKAMEYPRVYALTQKLIPFTAHGVVDLIDRHVSLGLAS